LGIYSIFALPESQVTITGGVGLDGITQGDGSHLVGEFITLGAGPLTPLNISDGGSDTNFDDNDINQVLDGAQTFDGISYADGTRVEAEYQFVLRDNSTGETYQVVGVNVVNSSPAFGTVEGLTFVGAFPPRGVALEVISANEGPGSFGQSSIDAGSFVTCFTTGTLIKTSSSEVAVEDLGVGDKVLTMDAGYQPIRWIGGRKVSATELRNNPNLKPICICADALGPGRPRQDLLVSPQHRVLVRSPIAARLFDSTEVLIPAKKLLELPGIDVEDGDDGVEYFHILFDAHQLVWSNGAVTESLFTGPEALNAMSPEAREEIAALFPEILEPDFVPASARLIPRKGKDIRNLAQRSAKHGKPVQAETPGLLSL